MKALAVTRRIANRRKRNIGRFFSEIGCRWNDAEMQVMRQPRFVSRRGEDLRFDVNESVDLSHMRTHNLVEDHPWFLRSLVVHKPNQDRRLAWHLDSEICPSGLCRYWSTATFHDKFKQEPFLRSVWRTHSFVLHIFPVLWLQSAGGIQLRNEQAPRWTRRNRLLVDTNDHFLKSIPKNFVQFAVKTPYRRVV